jgi:uncharacterized surface protein with fasciclin (FAS1) repeats
MAASEEAMASSEAAATPGDIIDIASTTEGFSTLAAAVTAAGLVDTLKGTGPFTVFAPNDAAFAALPAGILDGEVATVEGQKVTLSTANGVTVNDATVVQADVVGSNGVIHVIDVVLLPPDVDVAALTAG